MIYINAARVPQDVGYAVWKNSYISPLFPRESIKSMASKLPNERIRFSLCVEYIQQLFRAKDSGYEYNFTRHCGYLIQCADLFFFGFFKS